jgi:hypothetical protein
MSTRFYERASLGRRGLALLGAVLAAIGAAWLVSQHSSNAHASAASKYASCPALSSTATTGLPLVNTAVKPWVPGDSTSPVFPATVPASAGNFPIPYSIRRVSVSLSTASVWIAKSTDGGVCVLVSPHKTVEGPPAIGISCSEASNLSGGASGEVSSSAEPGRIVVAGVAPNGVQQVVHVSPLSSGAVKKLTVSDNAWAFEVDSAAALAAKRARSSR